tara:strand:- start:4 stop:1116 length:1113 start_codon:yes stop_codon:yes gene_type:complete
MKVLHISRSLSHDAGGLYYSVSGLTKAQNKLDELDISVLGGCSPLYTDDLEEWEEVDIHPLPTNGSYGRIVAGCRKIDEIRPDIIHQHGIWSAVSIWGRYGLLKNIPCVVSPRGMLDPWIMKRSTIKKSIHGMLFENPLSRRGYFHALTESEVGDIGQYNTEARRRTIVVPNGVEVPKKPIELEAKQGVVFLGRLHEKKQARELVKYWRLSNVLAQHDLTIVGWGEEGYINLIKSEISMSQNIIYQGPAFGIEKRKILERAKYFILPSLSEGLPMAVLEAISYGCIPIITDECNLPELIKIGVAERLRLDLQNLEEIIVGMEKLSLAELRIRQNNAMLKSRDFSWSHQAKIFQKLYTQILSEHTPNPECY